LDFEVYKFSWPLYLGPQNTLGTVLGAQKTHLLQVFEEMELSLLVFTSDHLGKV
jgi:hypothetical protein